MVEDASLQTLSELLKLFHENTRCKFAGYCIVVYVAVLFVELEVGIGEVDVNW